MGFGSLKDASWGRSCTKRNTSLRCFLMFLRSTFSPAFERFVRSRTARALNGMSSASSMIVTPSTFFLFSWRACVVGVVQQDRRKADYILIYGYPRPHRVFGQVQTSGPSRKKLDHERKTLVGRSVEAIELLRPIGPLAGLVSACVEERAEGCSERCVDHLNAEHHVDVLGRSEIKTGRVE